MSGEERCSEGKGLGLFTFPGSYSHTLIRGPGKDLIFDPGAQKPPHRAEYKALTTSKNGSFLRHCFECPCKPMHAFLDPSPPNVLNGACFQLRVPAIDQPFALYFPALAVCSLPSETADHQILDEVL